MTNPFAPQGQQAPPANPFNQQAPQAPLPQQPAAPQAPAQPQYPPAQQQQQPPQAPPPQQQPAAPRQPQQDGFDQPAQGWGDAITQDDWMGWVGALMLFEVHELRTGLVTKNTPPGETTSAILATVHVIDVQPAPVLKDNALVFPPALVTALRKTAQNGGGRVLGRLAPLRTQAGRDTVQLAEYTDADANTARQYLAWRASQSMQQPAQQAPAQQGGEPPF